MVSKRILYFWKKESFWELTVQRRLFVIKLCWNILMKFTRKMNLRIDKIRGILSKMHSRIKSFKSTTEMEDITKFKMWFTKTWTNNSLLEKRLTCSIIIEISTELLSKSLSNPFSRLKTKRKMVLKSYLYQNFVSWLVFLMTLMNSKEKKSVNKQFWMLAQKRTKFLILWSK